MYVAALGIGVGDDPADLVGLRIDFGQQRLGTTDKNVLAPRGDRARCALDGDSRSLLQSFLTERHKLASRNHPHLIGDCDRTGVRNSRLRDYALRREVNLDDRTRTSAHHVRTVVGGRQISARQAKVDGWIGLASPHVKPDQASIGDHPHSVGCDVEMTLIATLLDLEAQHPAGLRIHSQHVVGQA